MLVEYSNHQIKFDVELVFWKFCCGLKRNENQTTFLEFFKLLYQNNYYNYGSENLPFLCAHEAQSLIASQQLINFTEGIVELYHLGYSYYDAASIAFVAVSAAESLLEMRFYTVSEFFLHKLCNATTNYSQLKKVTLEPIYPSNVGCFLQKSISADVG